MASDVDGRMDLKRIWWRMERILAISGFDTWLEFFASTNVWKRFDGLGWPGVAWKNGAGRFEA